MTQHEQANLEALGFQRMHDGRGLRGQRLWWHGQDGEVTVIRQRDKAEKCAEYGRPGTQGTRQEALALATDALITWKCGTCGHPLAGQGVEADPGTTETVCAGHAGDK